MRTRRCALPLPALRLGSLVMAVALAHCGSGIIGGEEPVGYWSGALATALSSAICQRAENRCQKGYQRWCLVDEHMCSPDPDPPASLCNFAAARCSQYPASDWCDVAAECPGTVSGTLRAWQPVTITFKGPAALESDDNPNPFLDFRLQARFHGPSDQIYDVPGFFDGDGGGNGNGSAWRVRFTPDESGPWHLKASFRAGTNVAIRPAAQAGTATGFDGVELTFNVAARDNNAPGFLGKGQVAYAGGHYLKTLGDGKVFLKGGTDSPENLLAYAGFDNTSAGAKGIHRYAAHAGDWKMSDPDWGGGKGKGIIGALNYLSANRVNSVYFLPMNIGGDGQDTWPYSGNIDRAGDPANDNLHFDISKLHQWEIVFDHAQRKGILLHFVLNEGETANKKELDNGELGVERKLYYRELVARFGHHNGLQWNLCEEWDQKGFPGQTAVRAWAQHLRSIDPYGHPVTIHNARNGLNLVIGDARFDLSSTQYYPGQTGYPNHSYGDQVEIMRDASAAAGRAIPISMDEFWRSALDDDNSHDTTFPYVSGQSFLRKNVVWPIYLSGGQLEVFLEGALATDDFRPYANLWRYVWNVRKLLESMPLRQMAPRDELLSGEASGYDDDGQVLAKPGEVYVVFLPVGDDAGALDLSGESGPFLLRWYNPRTGVFAGNPKSVIGGGPTNLGSPPSQQHQDWVVVVQKDT